MNKIITLFQRNHETDKLVRDEVTPGAEWVVSGEGVSTRKFDGTCCMIRGGKLYRRYEANYRPIRVVGRALPDWLPLRPLPSGFEPATELDENTGKVQGWVPVGDGPEDRWHREAFASDQKWNGGYFDKTSIWADGTYELIGPKVQGNPERWPIHQLVPHPYIRLLAFPRTFDAIKAAFADPEWDMEGVVFHHEDGKMVKIKAKDFGFSRKRSK